MGLSDSKVLLSKAVALKIPIVSDDFVDAVIENGGIDGFKLSKYIITLDDSEEETKPAKKEPKGKEKEKAQDSSSEEGNFSTLVQEF